MIERADDEPEDADDEASASRLEWISTPDQTGTNWIIAAMIVTTAQPTKAARTRATLAAPKAS
ncbi:hypothetical protein AB7C87_02450 [Natrarchaeobius sp. A-rgal3]|uniref:hypothetical protein n=1 Tax=Natrarchaeobius versutus TaxID=1679078 RepID=UPI00350FDE60